LATILKGGSGDYEVQADGSLRDSYTHLKLKVSVGKRRKSIAFFAGVLGLC
jgi:hypothetical protein